MKKIVGIIVLGLLLVSVGAGVYFGQKNNRAGELLYSGTIEATEVTMSFQAPGRVAEVYVQEGRRVKKGELLAELDRADYEARHAQARANLARAEKAKQQARTALNIYEKTLPAEVARAEAAFSSATDTLENAKKNYLRFEELFQKGVVSEKERDTMKLSYDLAEARLAEAQSLLHFAQGNLPRALAARQEIEVAASQIEAARAALQSAAVHLDYTRLLSPIDGVVTSRAIEPGETVAVGREVMTLSDHSRVELNIFVEETQIGRISPGAKAQVSIDNFPGKVYDGVVSFVSPEGEFTPKIIQTKKERVRLVYRVKITIDNPSLELKTGMPADAELKP